MEREVYLYAYNRNTGDFCEKKVELKPYFPESFKDKWEVSIDVFEEFSRFDCTRIIKLEDIDNKVLSLINFKDEGLAYISTEKDILKVQAIFANYICGTYVNELEELKEQENQLFDKFHKEMKFINKIISTEQEHELEVEL